MTRRQALKFIKKYDRLIVLALIGLVVSAIYLTNYLLLPRYSRLVTQRYDIPFQTTTQQDCSLNTGTNQVTTKGVGGVGEEVYKWSYVGNKVISKIKVSDKTIVQPVNEVINQGAKNPNPPNYSNLGSALASQNDPCVQQEQLNCNLSNLFTLEGASNGSFTPQQYNAYVQLMQKYNCGTPKPYCTFTPSNPCPGASSTDGYDAGYQYAQDNQICDTSYSDGNSDAFNQGVQDWASANCTDGQPN